MRFLFLFLIGLALFIDLQVAAKRMKRKALSCVELQKRGLPTGEYALKVAGRRGRVRVWCEMALGEGGGYTFVHPTEYYLLSPAEQKTLLSQIYTDTSNVLLRVRNNDGKQPYSVLKQLSARSSNPIYVGMSEHDGYAAPQNTKPSFMVDPFLYIGFFTINEASVKGMTQGLSSNGKQCSFANCDANPNSYLALFPDLTESPSTTYGQGWPATGPCGCIRDSLKHNPSGHVMPGDFFMFTELHWGGCGCYDQTDHTSDDILGTAIGFK